MQVSDSLSMSPMEVNLPPELSFNAPRSCKKGQNVDGGRVSTNAWSRASGRAYPPLSGAFFSVFGVSIRVRVVHVNITGRSTPTWATR
jgi:hypothetical protein